MTSSPTARESSSALIAAVGLFLLAAGLWIFFKFLLPAPEPAPSADPEVALKLPTLQLAPLTGGGERVHPSSLSGKVTLINFWGTWCPPCVKEFPHLVDLADRFERNKNFVFLAVSCQPGTEEEEPLRQATEQFLESRNFHVPTYWDPSSITRGAVAQTIGFNSYPTTLLIDGEGFVRKYWRGYSPGTEDEMLRAVVELLATLPPESPETEAQ